MRSLYPLESLPDNICLVKLCAKVIWKFLDTIGNFLGIQFVKVLTANIRKICLSIIQCCFWQISFHI